MLRKYVGLLFLLAWIDSAEAGATLLAVGNTFDLQQVDGRYPSLPLIIRSTGGEEWVRVPLPQVEDLDRIVLTGIAYSGANVAWVSFLTTMTQGE